MKKIIAVAAALAVIAGIYFIFFTQTEEGKVKKQFATLADYASKYPGETATTGVYKSQFIANVFDDTCALSANDAFLSGDYTKEELRGKSLMFRKMLNSAIITFHDIAIESLDDKKAKVTTTVKISAKDNSNNSIEQTREMEVLLLKKDGKWLFSDFRIANILKK